MRILQLLYAAAVVAAVGCSGTGPPEIIEPQPSHTYRTITGRVGYQKTGPQLANFDEYGRLIPQRGFAESRVSTEAPLIPIEIVDLHGIVLGQGRTDSRGQYSIKVSFGPNPATQVVVRAIARIDLPFGMIVQVFPTRVSGNPYRAQSAPGGNPDDEVMEVDLDISLDAGAAAFYMLDVLWEGLPPVREGLQTTLPDLDIYWSAGNGETSWFETEGGRGKLTVAGGITGDTNSNQDAWDGPKVMRLLGEYLFGFFFHHVAPAGTPNDALLVPSAAYREGFLDFWACVGRESPVYWDTVGSGPDGRVVRFFRLESFFDPSLPSLGTDDPNVYQGADDVGLGSRHSVAEVLWDIHDPDSPSSGDNDGIDAFPLFLTLRFMSNANQGADYPYLFTLFREYDLVGAIDAANLHVLLWSPEDHGMAFPGTVENGCLWPPPIAEDDKPLASVGPPYEKTLSDKIDTLNPDPVNLEIGFWSQRYFRLNLGGYADLTATLTTTGDLALELLDLRNEVIAVGPSPLVVRNLAPREYVIRVRSASDPQEAPFELNVQLSAP